MKKYFLYELKRRGFVTGCLALIAAVVYLTPIMMLSGGESIDAYDTHLWLISAIGGVLAACLPLWLFEYKLTKRGLDLFYSLPLSHTKILLVRFLTGLVILFFAYTVAYWLGAFLLMAKFFGQLNAVLYLPQFFSSLIPVYFIYAISSFVFTRANKFIDGVMFVIFWAFAAPLVASVFNIVSNKVNAYYFLPFAPLDAATAYFQERLIKRYTTFSQLSAVNTANMITGFIITSLLALGATVGLFVLEGRAKAENAGQISESPFGYKVMLPLLTACLAIAGCSEMGFWVIFLVMVAVGSLALTVLYKRTIRIGVKQAIIYCVSFIGGIILYFIISGLTYII